MAAKENVELQRLFSTLQRATEEEEDEQVLNITKKILELSPDDPDALQCKLVSLIHLSRFDSALQLIWSLRKTRKGGEGKVFQLEEAYCLYRQDKYEETLAVLSSLPQTDAKVQELMAQVAYRQEQYQKAVNLYQQLLEVTESRQERLANYYAALSLCPGPSNQPPPLVEATETMEQCFNLACYSLLKGQCQRAMQHLTKAETLYQASLEEEGYSEEEIAEEMVVIQVQKGYCYQVMESVKEAMSCYSTTLKLRPDDPTLIAVVSNNILAINRDKDVFDSKKKVKVLANEGNSRKLTRLQKQKILFNRCLFALQTNQLEQCRELAAALKATDVVNSDLAVLAEVALLNREKKSAGAVEALSNYLKSSPKAGVGLYATLAQLQLAQGSVPKACDTLQSVPTFSRYVGVASTVASLRAALGDVSVAVEVLEQTLEYWVGRGQGEKHVLPGLVKQVAKFELSHSRPKGAAKVLEQQLRTQDSMELRALLISAFSQYDPQAAEQASRSLPAFSMPPGIDVTKMEQTPVFRHSRRPAPDKTVDTGKGAEVKTKHKKKKRKPRLPKNYDPSVPPDPERWLPLRERSYYRRSRRKGGVIPSVRGTQGSSAASANLMNQLDASKQPPVKPDAAPDAKSEGTAKPKTQQASKKKQKKKKGGKW